MTFLQALWPLGAVYLVLFAAACDLHSMRIPNWISLALLGWFVVGIPFGLVDGLLAHLITFVIATAILLGLYFMGLAGGGDIKLLAALSLWVGPLGIVPFMLVMSVTGGLMAALALLIVKNDLLKGRTFKWTDSWLARLARGERVVAYGVAIAIGFLAALTKIYLSGA